MKKGEEKIDVTNCGGFKTFSQDIESCLESLNQLFSKVTSDEFFLLLKENLNELSLTKIQQLKDFLSDLKGCQNYQMSKEYAEKIDFFLGFSLFLEFQLMKIMNSEDSFFLRQKEKLLEEARFFFEKNLLEPALEPENKFSFLIFYFYTKIIKKLSKLRCSFNTNSNGSSNLSANSKKMEEKQQILSNSPEKSKNFLQNNLIFEECSSYLENCIFLLANDLEFFKKSKVFHSPSSINKQNERILFGNVEMLDLIYLLMFFQSKTSNLSKPLKNKTIFEVSQILKILKIKEEIEKKENFDVNLLRRVFKIILLFFSFFFNLEIEEIIPSSVFEFLFFGIKIAFLFKENDENDSSLFFELICPQIEKFFSSHFHSPKLKGKILDFLVQNERSFKEISFINNTTSKLSSNLKKFFNLGVIIKQINQDSRKFQIQIEEKSMTLENFECFFKEKKDRESFKNIHLFFMTFFSNLSIQKEIHKFMKGNSNSFDISAILNPNFSSFKPEMIKDLPNLESLEILTEEILPIVEFSKEIFEEISIFNRMRDGCKEMNNFKFESSNSEEDIRMIEKEVKEISEIGERKIKELKSKNSLEFFGRIKNISDSLLNLTICYNEIMSSDIRFDLAKIIKNLGDLGKKFETKIMDLFGKAIKLIEDPHKFFQKINYLPFLIHLSNIKFNLFKDHRGKDKEDFIIKVLECSITENHLLPSEESNFTFSHLILPISDPFVLLLDLIPEELKLGSSFKQIYDDILNFCENSFFNVENPNEEESFEENLNNIYEKNEILKEKRKKYKEEERKMLKEKIKEVFTTKLKVFQIRNIAVELFNNYGNNQNQTEVEKEKIKNYFKNYLSIEISAIYFGLRESNIYKKKSSGGGLNPSRLVSEIKTHFKKLTIFDKVVDEIKFGSKLSQNIKNKISVFYDSKNLRESLNSSKSDEELTKKRIFDLMETKKSEISSFFSKENIKNLKDFFEKKINFKISNLKEENEKEESEIVLKVIKKLGKGSFKSVYAVEIELKSSKKSNKYEFAMKFMNNFENDDENDENLKKMRKNGENESKIMRSLMKMAEFDNIVRLYGNMNFKNGKNEVYLFFYELSDLNFRDFIEMFSKDFKKLENEMKNGIIIESILILSEVSQQMNKLNQLGYFHSNLKPENILLWRNSDKTFLEKVKICDFGNSVDNKSNLTITNNFKDDSLSFGVIFNDECETIFEGFFEMERVRSLIGARESVSIFGNRMFDFKEIEIYFENFLNNYKIFNSFDEKYELDEMMFLVKSCNWKTFCDSKFDDSNSSKKPKKVRNYPSSLLCESIKSYNKYKNSKNRFYQLNFIKFFLTKIDPFFVDENGESLMHLMVRCNQFDLISNLELFKEICTFFVNQRNNFKRTPFDLSVELGYFKIASYILSHFPVVVFSNDITESYLLKKKSQINQINQNSFQGSTTQNKDIIQNNKKIFVSVNEDNSSKNNVFDLKMESVSNVKEELGACDFEEEKDFLEIFSKFKEKSVFEKLKGLETIGQSKMKEEQTKVNKENALIQESETQRVYVSLSGDSVIKEFKMIKKNENDEKNNKNLLIRIFNEVQVLLQVLKRENDFVQLIGTKATFNDNPNGMLQYSSFKIILERCDYDLSQFLNKFSPLPPKFLFFNLIPLIVIPVVKFWQLGFIHRDLKPSQFFVSILNDKKKKLKVVLGDFDLSIHESQTRVTEIVNCGTKFYVAPEMVMNSSSSCNQSSSLSWKMDLFSLGVTLFEVLFGLIFPETKQVVDKSVCAKTSFIFESLNNPAVHSFEVLHSLMKESNFSFQDFSNFKISFLKILENYFLGCSDNNNKANLNSSVILIKKLLQDNLIYNQTLCELSSESVIFNSKKASFIENVTKLEGFFVKIVQRSKELYELLSKYSDMRFLIERCLDPSPQNRFSEKTHILKIIQKIQTFSNNEEISSQKDFPFL